MNTSNTRKTTFVDCFTCLVILTTMLFSGLTFFSLAVALCGGGKVWWGAMEFSGIGLLVFCLVLLIDMVLSTKFQKKA